MKLIILDGSNSQPNSKYYNLAYQLWLDGWTKTFNVDFNQDKKLNSDEFTRQDFWVCIFDGLKPVGITALRKINLHCKTLMSDSWFFCFNQAEINNLKDRNFNQGLVASNVMLAEEYRKSKQGGNIALNLFRYVTLAALDYNFDVMLGASNNNRGVDKLCEAVGGSILTADKDEYNIKVNTMYFTPESISRKSISYPDDVLKNYKNALWLTNKIEVNNDIRKKA